MKRLLAHSTIENMGIVAADIGAAMIFMATGHQVVAGIALIAALYHLANHSVYKALLFIGTGAVEAGTGTRDLDRLGGIVRRMPWTSAFFLVGVMSISALPPLNGFVSEWLTLADDAALGACLSSTAIKVVFAISGALLALTAGLAVTCFAKVFAMGFLGMPRSDGAAARGRSAVGARELPLALLAASCILLGILPTYVIPVIDRAVTPLSTASATAALVPPFFSAAAQRQEGLPRHFVAEFHDLGAQVGRTCCRDAASSFFIAARNATRSCSRCRLPTCSSLLAAILALVFVVFRLLSRGRAVMRGPVWDGGLRHLWPADTYTATGFSNPGAGHLRAPFCSRRPSRTARRPSLNIFGRRSGANHAEIHIVDRLVLDPPDHGPCGGSRQLRGKCMSAMSTPMPPMSCWRCCSFWLSEQGFCSVTILSAEVVILKGWRQSECLEPMILYRALIEKSLQAIYHTNITCEPTKSQASERQSRSGQTVSCLPKYSPDLT